MASVDVEVYQEGLAVSTGVMVFLLIVLFPLFPFFMLYRIVKHHNYPHKKISDCKLMGTILLVMSILWYIVAFGSGPSGTGIALVTIFMFLPSLWLYNKASTINRAINERCVQYRNYIYVDGVTSIAEMAKLTGQRVKVVRNEVKRFIETGHLPDLETHGDRILRLDINWNHPHVERNQETVIRVEVSSPDHCDHPSHRSEASRAPKPKTVECHGCGVSLTIMEGETKRCEYCGNTVS